MREIDNMSSGDIDMLRLKGMLPETPCAPLANDITYQLNQFRAAGNSVFTAEASDLGWPPGMWPRRFKVNGLGNGQYFVKMTERDGVKIYCQEFGCTFIKVWND